MPGFLLFVLISVCTACVCGLTAWGWWLIFCLRAAKLHGLQAVAATAPEIAEAYRRAALFSWVGVLLAVVMPRLARAVGAALADEGKPSPDDSRSREADTVCRE
jgi:hypothetical protein